MAKRKPAPRRDSRRQFAALPWRSGPQGLEILMITSRETRRWVVPKGWPMDDKTAWQAAAQEAYEEAGVQGDIETEALGAYHYFKRYKNRPDVLCVVDVFPLKVCEELAQWPEKEERVRAWMTARAAADAVDEPELAALIEAFEALTVQA